MAKPWSELVAKMSPERQAANKARTALPLKVLDHTFEVTEAYGLYTAKCVEIPTLSWIDTDLYQSLFGIHKLMFWYLEGSMMLPNFSILYRKLLAELIEVRQYPSYTDDVETRYTNNLDFLWKAMTEEEQDQIEGVSNEDCLSCGLPLVAEARDFGIAKVEGLWCPLCSDPSPC